MAIDYTCKTGEIILYLVSSKKYMNTNLSILKELINNKKAYCIYITVNRPYAPLITLLENEKIDTKRMFFIDAVTPTGNMRAGNVAFVGSPSALTDISLVAESTVKSLPKGGRILFLDSITALSIYNDAGTIIRFSHFLTNKIREWGLSGVVISLKKETDEKLLSQLSQFCDKIIEVD